MWYSMTINDKIMWQNSSCLLLPFSNSNPSHLLEYFRRDVRFCCNHIQLSKYRNGSVRSLLFTLTMKCHRIFSLISSGIPDFSLIFPKSWLSMISVVSGNPALNVGTSNRIYSEVIIIVIETGRQITTITEDTRDLPFLFQRLSTALQRRNAVFLTLWSQIKCHRNRLNFLSVNFQPAAVCKKQ